MADPPAEVPNVDAAELLPEDPHRPRRRLPPPRSQRQQRGLAAPVRSEEHPMLPGPDRQVDGAEDQIAADTDRSPVERDDLVPGQRTATPYGDASSSRTSPSSSKNRNRSISRMNQRSCVTATTVPS